MTCHVSRRAPGANCRPAGRRPRDVAQGACSGHHQSGAHLPRCSHRMSALGTLHRFTLAANCGHSTRKQLLPVTLHSGLRIQVEQACCINTRKLLLAAQLDTVLVTGLTHTSVSSSWLKPHRGAPELLDQVLPHAQHEARALHIRLRDQRRFANRLSVRFCDHLADHGTLGHRRLQVRL